jgi:recombination protein RecR
MNDQLPTLTKLLKQLQQVPYLASKNLYRVAHHFLQMDAQRLAQFNATLQEAHAGLKKCDVCCAWQEKQGGCTYCSSPRRDKGIICVVETWYDLYAIEKTGGFTGLYHVLGGAISPLDGIAPEDLSLPQLVNRLSSGCAELIFALNQTPEGEATSAYIARKINQAYPERTFKITCLSRGVPVGSSLESVDRVTVFKALAERRLF